MNDKATGLKDMLDATAAFRCPMCGERLVDVGNLMSVAPRLEPSRPCSQAPVGSCPMLPEAPRAAVAQP